MPYIIIFRLLTRMSTLMFSLSLVCRVPESAVRRSVTANIFRLSFVMLHKSAERAVGRWMTKVGCGQPTFHADIVAIVPLRDRMSAVLVNRCHYCVVLKLLYYRTSYHGLFIGSDYMLCTFLCWPRSRLRKLCSAHFTIHYFYMGFNCSE